MTSRSEWQTFLGGAIAFDGERLGAVTACLECHEPVVLPADIPRGWHVRCCERFAHTPDWVTGHRCIHCGHPGAGKRQ